MPKRTAMHAPLDEPIYHGKRQCNNGSQVLCDVCNTVDFMALLTIPKTKPAKLGDLTKDFRNDTCPMCNLVRSTADAELESKASRSERKPAIVEVRQVRFAPSEQLRTTKVAPAFHIELVAHPRTRRAEKLATLDLSVGSNLTWDNNHEYRMLRRPLKSTLELPMLRSWLEESFGRWQQYDRERLLDDPCLESLITSGRFRLLDVATRKVVTLLYPERYVALSYVWGGRSCASAIRPITKSQTDLPNGSHIATVWTVDFDRLPRTIADTIRLVRKAGERYLWVDALCIDQSSHSDKSGIIKEMKSIYQRAYFTIIAAEGTNADAGLARVSQSGEAETILSFEQHGTVIQLQHSRPTLDDTLNNTTWNGRGWTFQEQVLSTICIYFTKNEVFSTCRGIMERESYVLEPNPLPVLPTKGRMVPKTGKRMTMQDALSRDGKYRRFSGDSTVRWNQYVRAVSIFTSRSLSHRGDRLDAFAGILSVLIKRVEEADYWWDFTEKPQALCGLLSDELYACLQWQPEKALRRQDRIRTNASGTEAMPSWSWIGWLCNVRFPVKPDLPRFGVTAPDDTNIICTDHMFKTFDGEIVHLKWPYTKLRQEALRDHVILHLWLPLLKCRLHKSSNNDGSRPQESDKYDVIWLAEILDDNVLSLGSISVSEDFIAADATDKTLYNFVILNVSQRLSLLMVERVGEYWERVALTEGPNDLPEWIPDTWEAQHIWLV